MTDGTLSIVADTHCHTGSGPLYHPDRGVLYWVDVPRGHLFEYDPVFDDHEHLLDYDGRIGALTLQADGSLLLFCDRGRVVPWHPEEGLGDLVVDFVDPEREQQVTGAVADPAGRVYVGTTAATGDGGRLYRLDADATTTVVEDDVPAPGGLAFGPDRARLYVTEPDADRVCRYDYDGDSGALSGRDTVVDATDIEGEPVGVAVDTGGCVWVPFRDGGRLAGYDPRGREQRREPFPARTVSATAFGGPDHDTAYVTTSLGTPDGDPGTRETEGAGAGALFAVNLGVSGGPVFRSRVGRD